MDWITIAIIILAITTFCLVWTKMNWAQTDWMVVATVIMAIGTICLALDTRKTANISLKQLELVSQPYLAVQKNMTRNLPQVDKDGFINKQYTDFFHFENVGQVLIKFKIDSLKLNNALVSRDNKDVEYILYPKQTFDYWVGQLPNKPGKPNDIINTYEIKIIFWANDVSEKKYFIKRECRFDNVTTTVLKDEVGPI